MGKQTIYLNDKIEDEIRAIAHKEKRPISEVICKIIAHSFESEKQVDILQRLENKIEAVYILTDLIVNEIGYVIGATRASTKSIETISREGHAYDAHLKRVSSAFKVRLNNLDPTARQQDSLSSNRSDEV